MRSVTPSRCGADDWICTSIIRALQDRRLAKSSHVGMEDRMRSQAGAQ